MPNKLPLYLIIGFIILLTLLVTLGLISQLRIFEMASPSMEPLIHGRTAPSSHDGDLVLVSKWINSDKLIKGDLVLVTFTNDNQNVKTFLMIEKCKGDYYVDPKKPSIPIRIPDNYFYLSGMNSNTIDSQYIGLFQSSQILGKVIKVFH
jgi:signal peptidase I